MIEIIQECQSCGLENVRGFGNTCVHCGAEEGDWRVKCTCGNELLWDKHGETLSPECPECGTPSNEFEVTDLDSATIINDILKRPDLHRTRVDVAVSFVETLMDFIHTKGTS